MSISRIPVEWLTGVLVSVVLVAGPTKAEPPATELFVVPNGNDAWSGRLADPKTDRSDGPLATLEGARNAVRRLKAQGPVQKPIRVLVRGGTYRITRPVMFEAQDSGTRAATITYAAWPGERPILSGGAPISGWKKANGPLWTAVLPEVREGQIYPRQLFVGGRRCTPARFPNEGTFRAAGPGVPLKNRNAAGEPPETRTSLLYQGEDLKPWANLDEAVVVVDPHDPQDVARLRFTVGAGPAADLQSERHVGERGPPGQQQILLQHEGDVSIRAFHPLAIDESRAFARRA